MSTEMCLLVYLKQRIISIISIVVYRLLIHLETHRVMVLPEIATFPAQGTRLSEIGSARLKERIPFKQTMHTTVLWLILFTF